MFRLLRRIAQRRLLSHLLIPIIVGMLVEAIIAYLNDKASDWLAIRHYLFSPERIGLYVGVLSTYIFLMYFFIRRDTDIGLKKLALAELDETLENAVDYFAIGTIRIREWFDPATEVYFATILKRRVACSGFRHERVLCFFTRADVKNLASPYLDGYYAKCLREVHSQFGIPLAFLERPQIFNILNGLNVKQRKLLRLYRWPISWLPEQVLINIRLNWLRRRIRRLSFSLVELKSGQKCAIRFSKRGQTLGLERVDDVETVQAYASIAQAVKNVIYWPSVGCSPPLLKAKHDFGKYFF